MYKHIIFFCLLLLSCILASCAPPAEEPAPFVPLAPKINPGPSAPTTCSSNAECGPSYCSENEQITPYCSFEAGQNNGICKEITSQCSNGCEQGECSGNECTILPGQPAKGCEQRHCSDNAIIAPFCDVSQGKTRIINGQTAQVGFCNQKELEFCPDKEICTEGYCKGLPCQADSECAVDYCDRGQVIRPFCQFRDPATGTLMQQGFCSHKVPLECGAGKECRLGSCKISTQRN